MDNQLLRTLEMKKPNRHNKCYNLKSKKVCLKIFY